MIMTDISGERQAFEALSSWEQSQRARDAFSEIGQQLHTVQYSIHGHKVALSGLVEAQRQRELSEDEVYSLEFHSGARRRLHRRNHQLEAVHVDFSVATYIQQALDNS